MKKFIRSIAGAVCVSAAIIGCNSGTTSTSYTPTQYEFTGLTYTINAGSSGCTTSGLFNFVCPSTFTSFSISDLGFSSNPASYLVILPTSSLPAGVGLNTSGTCQTSQVITYGQCSISISANNVASGSIVSIPLNGSLGQQNFITVTFQ